MKNLMILPGAAARPVAPFAPAAGRWAVAPTGAVAAVDPTRQGTGLPVAGTATVLAQTTSPTPGSPSLHGASQP